MTDLIRNNYDKVMIIKHNKSIIKKSLEFVSLSLMTHFIYLAITY